jgi:hypothetical protein
MASLRCNMNEAEGALQDFVRKYRVDNEKNSLKPPTSSLPRFAASALSTAQYICGNHAHAQGQALKSRSP